METFGYPEALHVLLINRVDVKMGGARPQWYLTGVEDKHNPIASIPVIIRVNPPDANGDQEWGPWPPNNGDMHNTSFRRKDGADQKPIKFIKGTSAWAFHPLLRNGRAVRRFDWPKDQHIKEVDLPEGRAVVRITLGNGTEVLNEYHPDFFDLAKKWEIYKDSTDESQDK